MTADRTTKAGNGGVLIAGSFAVLNITTYALTVVAAHRLGPAEFGQYSSLMGVLLVVNVVSLGLQSTGARRVALSPDDRAAVEASLFRLTLICSALVAALTLVIGLALMSTLSITSWVSPVMLAAAAGLLTLFGGQAGVLQGEHRWRQLATLYAAVGVGRLVAGVIAIVIQPTTSALLTGVALGAVLPVGVGLLTLARSTPEVDPERAPVGLAREVAHSTHALLAFFAVSNVDILVARALLSEESAGLYAAGLVLTKAVLFLPQFVIVLAFPAMARAQHSRRTDVGALAAVGAVGAVASAVCWLLPGLTLAFVGGQSYAEVSGRLWQFAVLGTILAMAQLLVYSALAQAHRMSTLALWSALAGFIVWSWATSGIAELLTARMVTTALLLLALVAVLLTRRGSVRSVVPGPADADAHVQGDVHLGR